jgi:hypothetical protein
MNAAQDRAVTQIKKTGARRHRYAYPVDAAFFIQY